MKLYYHPVSTVCFDLHIALEVDASTLEAMCRRGRVLGVPTRGISDHEFIRSVYFQDPNGYVVELTAKHPRHDEVMEHARTGARLELQRWQTGHSRRHGQS